MIYDITMISQVGLEQLLYFPYCHRVSRVAARLPLMSPRYLYQSSESWVPNKPLDWDRRQETNTNLFKTQHNIPM
jgi:hypothetical protein